MKDSVCTACGTYGTMDIAHIQSKGAGGKDGPEDTIELCRLCHRIQHAQGWDRFIKMYPSVGESLDSRGWVIENIQGIPKLRRK